MLKTNETEGYFGKKDGKFASTAAQSSSYMVIDLTDYAGQYNISTNYGIEGQMYEFTCNFKMYLIEDGDETKTPIYLTNVRTTSPITNEDKNKIIDGGKKYYLYCEYNRTRGEAQSQQIQTCEHG